MPIIILDFPNSISTYSLKYLILLVKWLCTLKTLSLSKFKSLINLSIWSISGTKIKICLSLFFLITSKYFIFLSSKLFHKKNSFVYFVFFDMFFCLMSALVLLGIEGIKDLATTLEETA